MTIRPHSIRLLYCTAAALAALLLPACTQQPERPAPDGERRVVTLGGAVTEIAFALGRGNDIVGTDISSTYPAAATQLPQVGYWRTLSAEGVLSLRPTLVLAEHGAGPETALEQIEAAGVPVHRFGETLTPEQAAERIRAIASLLDAEQEGRELADTLIRAVGNETGPAPSDSSERRTMFAYIRGASVFHVGGRGTRADAMIRLAGGTNVATALDDWKPVSAEFFVQTQPEVLIVTASGLESMGGMEKLRDVPGLKETPAIRNNRVVVVDDLAFLGFGPRMHEALRSVREAYTRFAAQ